MKKDTERWRWVEKDEKNLRTLSRIIGGLNCD
jgi:hypothetical protein